MSVTVHTEAGPANHPNANRWDVAEHGSLWLIATDRTIAEYAAGSWFAITLDEAVETNRTGPVPLCSRQADDERAALLDDVRRVKRVRELAARLERCRGSVSEPYVGRLIRRALDGEWLA